MYHGLIIRVKYGIYATVVLTLITPLLLYIQAVYSRQGPIIVRSENFNPEKKYLVHSSKCRIPNLDPWTAEVLPFYAKKDFIPCSNKNPLTYVVISGDATALRINPAEESSYSYFGVKCCYSTVARNRGGLFDPTIRVSPCNDFENEISFYEIGIIVKCFDRVLNRLVYENAHAGMPINKNIRRRFRNIKAKPQPPSVILLGIDSVSRLNFHRVLPKTHKYLMTKNWIEYKGYNKIDDNTFPNMMAFLTGRNKSSVMDKCDPLVIGKLDDCNFAWDDFRKSGYVTAYAEDEIFTNTFTYEKAGFNNSPTDYYFQPYLEAAETLKVRRLDGMSYCTGPQTAGERVLNLAKDFIHKFGKHAKFGVFWTISFSHEDINDPGRMDDVLVRFFEEIHDDIATNTIFIFLSDHGIRFGDIRLTRTGWFEERLPFLYFWLPETFTNDFPVEFENVKANSHKLTTAYDLYVTLQDVLVLSGLTYNLKSSEACPKCKSLFSAIGERSCAEAAIEMHWCVCTDFGYLNPRSDLALEATSFAIDELNGIIEANYETASKCVRFKLDRIVSSCISAGDHENKTYVLITFKTFPISIMEVTLNVKDHGAKVFETETGFSRLDKYKYSSWCVSSSKLFCYCRWNWLSQQSFSGFWFEV